MSYTTRITKEGGGTAGASKMRFASGASLVGASGALNDWSAGRTVLGTLDAFSVGVAQTAGCFASSRLKLGIDIASSGTVGLFEIMDFGNGVKFFLGRTQNAPSADASPGSVIIRLPGGGAPTSATGWYVKAGTDGNPGSAGWNIFQTSASAG